MIRTTTIILALGLLLPSLSNAQTDATQGCVERAELKEVSKNFSQLEKYVNLGSGDQVCSAEMGSDWYQIAASLILLKNAAPDEPAEVSDDAFTFKAIQEKDWWAYFTKRANQFTIDNNCEPNVVAYVYGGFGGGRIYLCRPYFESNRSSQASVLMHEVRHFDGHRHVTCTRGNEEGNRGACDNRITSRGSYAISLQTLVGLSRSEKTEKTEKLLLESEAVYTAFNKFNTLPQLKMSDFMYLSKTSGEIFMVNVNDAKEEVKPLAQLNEPAVILNSFNRFTIYPSDASKEAYRMDRGFNEKVANPGLYAVHYNSLTPEQRSQYDSISYFGDGGLLANNKVQTLCNNQDLTTQDLSSKGTFTRMISIAGDNADAALKTYLLEKSGDIYSLECQSPESTRVNIAKTNLKIDSEIAGSVVESFTLGGSQYAMLEGGKLIGLDLQGSTYMPKEIDMPVANSDLVGATPLSIAEIFE